MSNSILGALLSVALLVLPPILAWLVDRYGRAAEKKKEQEAKIDAIGKDSTATDVTHTLDGL
jgi:hypothetical protein